MKVKINTYKKRDNSIMVYINNDRKVSIGLGERGLPARYKMTGGEQKLLDAFLKICDDSPKFTGSIEAHTELKVKLDRFWLLITDVGNIGGQHTGKDGAYLITPDNQLIDMDRWYTVDA